MSILDLTADTFDATVTRDGIVVVDCWAAWCGPCRQFGPVFERVAARHPDCLFAKLDTEAHRELVQSLGIQHIPSLMVYRDGILLYREPGSQKEEDLEDVLAQVASLDMDEVRADIEAEAAGAGDTGDG
jgi:thioredoxin 1